MENQMEIITKDLHLAAILVSYGSQIIKVDRTDAKRQWFHFDKVPSSVYVSDDMGKPTPLDVVGISDIRSLFLSKKIFFPPSFVDCLRSVKAALYQE